MKHTIRIRAVLPSRNEVQVEIEPTRTVAELKKVIASKVAGYRASDIRILQRSMELNDKGTLEYFRVFDGTKVDVVRKHALPTGSVKPAHDDAQERARDAKEKTAKPQGNPSHGGTTRTPSATRKFDSSDRQQPDASSKPRPQSAEPSRREDSRPPRSRPQSAPGGKLGAKDDTSKYLDDADDDDLLDRVARNVADLKRELRETGSRPRTADSTASDPAVEMWQRRAASLEERLKRSEERNEIAAQRIQELEQTVRRYQLLMKKVSLTVSANAA